MILGFRILPLTIAMAMIMLVIKVTDLVRGGSELSAQLLVSPVVAETKPQEEPAAKPAAEEGHGEGEKKEKKGKKEEAPPENKGTIATQRPQGTDEKRFTPAELDILQNLAKRRAELDKWEQNIQLKENLLSASEMRINEKIEQLDGLKRELSTLLEEYNKQEDAKVASLVKIYESMKPADAGRIFEEVEMPVLLEVVDRMAEKKAAPILANMTPRKAKELTEELAQRRKTANTRLDAVSKAVAPSPAKPAAPASTPTPAPATPAASASTPPVPAPAPVAPQAQPESPPAAAAAASSPAAAPAAPAEAPKP